MGRRGRDRAKQTKVARELKYFPPVRTDLAALQRELAAHQPRHAGAAGHDGPAEDSSGR